MLQKEELPVVINGMLRCVGYELVNNNLSEIVAQNGINGWIQYGRPNFLVQPLHQNTVFQFIDEHSNANLNAVAWYEDDILNFVVDTNFRQIHVPWYNKLPILQIAYNTSKNTAWFMYQRHCIVGSIDENKQFKANRITTIMNNSIKKDLTLLDIIEELNYFYDSNLTVEVLKKEIELDDGETCGLPDLIRFFKERQML
jgi:hypothetical protein